MGLELFNKRSRPLLFRRLSEEQFDLLIIGGGIMGASILRDAVLRGMHVALLEANDFASGTSGRSSKLIHGGLRYLKNLGFRLAWQSCHERNLHLRLNSRLVQPLPFLIPLARDSGDSITALRAGMWLYEIMSGFRNYRLHQSISRGETLSVAPGLSSEKLIGGILYYDAVVDDNRWTLETVKDGVRNGGVAINHAPVTGFLKEGNQVAGVVCRDRLGNTTYEARAKVVVNAAGAWVDQIRRLDCAEASDLVRLSKGTHLIFPEADVPLSMSTVLFSPLDGRPLFMIRRQGCYIFGTIDDWQDAEPGAPIPGEHDVEYLLDSLRQSMPNSNLDRNKVQFVYSGFRALPIAGNRATKPSAATREDVIKVDPSGLISVVGGKLTTARIMAIRVLRHVLHRIGKSRRYSPCQTGRLPIGDDNEQGSGPGVMSILPELTYACRYEMACTLEDLAERPSGFLHWNNDRRLERLRQAAPLICAELAMSDAEFEREFHDYEKRLGRLHSLPEQASDTGTPTVRHQ